ncbi:hypothetical protein DPMN_073062 [Dreissena polymorpha]|uniref:Uncharacterized protein n=1 Tax=Dreissena polymorpha TaxID=45954 RepID=A0A9D4BYG6_DREPO|nr:hypothetical protein DPMN_073062 [Dreissena polymorpha]
MESNVKKNALRTALLDVTSTTVTVITVTLDGLESTVTTGVLCTAQTSVILWENVRDVCRDTMEIFATYNVQVIV